MERYNGDKVVVWSTGTSFCGLLTIAFIVLKLCNIINWSWLWVLSPIWIPWSLVIFVCIIICFSLIFRKD